MSTGISVAQVSVRVQVSVVVPESTRRTSLAMRIVPVSVAPSVAQVRVSVIPELVDPVSVESVVENSPVLVSVASVDPVSTTFSGSSDIPESLVLPERDIPVSERFTISRYVFPVPVSTLPVLVTPVLVIPVSVVPVLIVVHVFVVSVFVIIPVFVVFPVLMRTVPL